SEPVHLDGLKDGVQGLAFSANGADLLAQGNKVAEVKRWDASTGEGRATPYRLRDEPAGKIVFRERGEAVVSVRVVEIPRDDFAALGGIASLRGNATDLVRVLAVSADGETLIAGAAEDSNISKF